MLKDILTFRVFIAECLLPHVAQADGTLAAAVNKLVAFCGMELGCSYDFRQFFHIRRFNIDNIWID